MTEPSLHSLDKALAQHIAECTRENRHMWAELRSLKHAIYTAIGIVIGTLGSGVLYFGAKALHL